MVAVDVDVMAMAMNACVWSEERDEGLQPSGGLSGRPEQETPPLARQCKSPSQRGLWPPQVMDQWRRLIRRAPGTAVAEREKAR